MTVQLLTVPEAATTREEPTEVLTAEEAAVFLRIGKGQLYEAAGRGDIPCKRIGRTIRFSRSALVRWLGAEE